MKWTGETIRNLAKERGLPLTKVAEEIEVSRQTINDWINGQVPKGNHLISLSKILQAKPDDFFSNNSEPLISIPVHRVRKRAKVTPDMQRDSLELACQYELFFRNVSESEVVRVIRISERNETSAVKIAKELRLISDLRANAFPIDYEHTFKLMHNLGIIIIFRYFPESIKNYAFYTKIYKHRVVFVNNSTNIIDLIFPLLHDSIHAIRDEEYLDGIYDEEEENFCDTIANYIQFPDEYVKYVYDAISGLSKAFQINKLKMFSKEHGHCLYGIVKRIRSLYPDFALNVGGADGNLRKDFQSIGDFLFKSAEPRDYVNKLRKLSPRLVELIIDQLDNITYRKLGELLGLQRILDAKAVKEELSSLRKGNFSL